MESSHLEVAVVVIVDDADGVGEVEVTAEEWEVFVAVVVVDDDGHGVGIGGTTTHAVLAVDDGNRVVGVGEGTTHEVLAAKSAFFVVVVCCFSFPTHRYFMVIFSQTIAPFLVNCESKPIIFSFAQTKKKLDNRSKII
jgi:hypothetical protein